MAIDPILLEVLRNRLDAIADEMELTLAPRGRGFLLFRLVLERPVLASAASAASAVFAFMGSAAAPFGSRCARSLLASPLPGQ